MKTLFRLTLFIFLTQSVIAIASTQEQKIDSLEKVLKTNITDSNKIEIYGQIFNYYFDRDQKKSSEIIHEVFKFSKLQKNKLAEGEAYNMLGVQKKNIGELDSAIFYHSKAETIFRQEKNDRHLGYCLMNLGNNIKRKGDLKLATEKFKEAIEIGRKINDKDMLASNLLNLGLVEHEKNNLNLVFTYYFEALKIFEEIKSKNKYVICCINISNLFSDQKKYDESNKYLMLGKEKAGDNPRLLSAIYGNIANNYMQLEQYEKSIEYYKLALLASEKSGNLNSAALCHSNLGLLYSRIKQFNVAISHLKLAEKEFIQEDSKSDLAELYRSYGVAYKEWGKYNEAIHYFNKTLAISNEFNFPSVAQYCLLELSRAYYKLADYKNAYNYAEKYIILNDSIANAQSIEKMLEVQTKYETEKKELEIKNLQGEKKLKNIELEKSTLEIKKQNQQKIFFAVGFVLIGVLALFIFKNLREKQKANAIITQQKLEVEKQKDIVEEQHKEITDSINYAQRIQQAMLPSNSDLEKIIPNSFVLLLPKNVVSGDFYWFTKQNNFVFYVTVDCTGHGVPGGFMSMLGISLLNQIVNEKKIIEPAEILNLLKSSVISSLKQSGNSGESRDGMDLCLCRIDTTNNNLTYAAANNSLYLVSENTITEYKGDKQPIGYHNGEESSFTQHTIQLQKNDLIYTTTDGYPDQFGGEKGKKFRYKNFENLLLEISVMAMQEQHTTIKSKFYEWKKDFEQTDDVCVIGIKI